MTNPHSFGQVLSTSTLLALALSFNAFSVTASEQGNYAGHILFNLSDFEVPAQIAERPRDIDSDSKVLGYTVQTAAAFGAVPTNTNIESILNPIDDTEPTPMPIVTTTTPTSTPSMTFSNVTSHNNNDRTATITWDSTIETEGYGVNWYEVGSTEEYWHYAGGEHVLPATSHSVTLGDRENWTLNEGSTYTYQVCNAVEFDTTPTCSENHSFIYASFDPSSPYDLEIESIEALATGLKFKFCNNGAATSSFPVHITVDSTQRTFDLNSPLAQDTCTFQTWTYDTWGITPTSGTQHAVEVVVNRHSPLIETSLLNNTLQQWITIPAVICAGPGLRADIYGGPNQVCCNGLVLQGGICNNPPQTPPADDTNEKVAVCHKTGANTMVEIVTDMQGWLNGHAQHVGDYLKGSLPCRVPKDPSEPLLTEPRKDRSADSTTDTRINGLQNRIARLEYKLSQVGQMTVLRERNRERIIDNTLVQRLAGRLLIQPQSVGEVWYVDPVTKQKYYLKDGTSAYQALKAFGLGISEEDFKKLDDGAFARSLHGKILLRVHSHGEAYYIDDAGVAHYLKDSAAAYELMRTKALGISNDDISKISTGSLAD